MTQPSFVPIAEADQVRPARRLQVPRGWRAARPAEITVPMRPVGPSRGTPGPDKGFALRLVRRFADQLRLTDDELSEDALVGCALLAARRSALMGRAPSVHDVRAVLGLWGFLHDPATLPAELVAARREAFRAAAHDYVVQRALVDQVPEERLRLTADEVGAGEPWSGWRSTPAGWSSASE